MPNAGWRARPVAPRSASRTVLRFNYPRIVAAILALAFTAALSFAQSLPSVPSSNAPIAPQSGAQSARSATPPLDATLRAAVHGIVKSGATPLPGVSITATNTLTGTKYTTATDVHGIFSMHIMENGRYVLRTDFAGFASTTKEVLLNAATPHQQADFSLVLASRQRQLDLAEGDRQPANRGEAGTGGARGQGGPGMGGKGQGAQGQGAQGQGAQGSGAQILGLLAGNGGAIAAGNDAGNATGASLPSVASNSDFSSDSVAVSGQSGTTSPLAGINMDQLRDNIENLQQQQTLAQIPGGDGGGGGHGGRGGGGFGGGPGGNMGFGGRGMNFRKLNPNRPHGAIFWTGGNSALDAKDFALRGQPIAQPNYHSNHFGLTIVGAPYIPHLIEHDTKDFLFFTVAAQRSTSPFDQYGTVPDAQERAGNLSALTTPGGLPITVYDPRTGQPFPNNTLRQDRISPQAQALLNYVPLPNLPAGSLVGGNAQNYQRLTTAGNNMTTLGLRYVRNFGGGSAVSNMIQQFMGASAPGLRQNINANFNLSHTATDELNLFPALSGKQQTHQYSLQLGYTLGVNKLTNNFSFTFNRTQNELRNNFTNTQDIASSIGLNIFNGLGTNPINYGLPNVTLSQFSSLSEQQPNFQTNQTYGLSESSSWIHGRHNIKFGGDFKRVQFDLIGQANSTGTFIFTGFATQGPGSNPNSGTGTNGPSGVPTNGSALADLLLGLPQQTAIQAPYQKAYLRANIYDAFLQDDWRVRPNFTVLAGLRYEYFSPYAEKSDRLATLDPGNDFASVAVVTPNAVGPYNGKYPRTLLKPDRNDFSPRVGFAWKAYRNTVVRGGYGINFANGQYVKFVQDLAFQPPFADVQTNQATAGAAITLANGFLAPQTFGNYSVNKNFRLPYVQVWNLDVQRTLPWGIVLNVGWNGAKGTKLDIVSAPGRNALVSLSGVYYDYENSTAFSNYNAGTVRLRKRLGNGIALGATYTYSHGIDNASSIGGNGGTGLVPAQNWQNLLAEESNSSFDIRHRLKGDFLYQLPFGPDAHYLSSGDWFSHAISNVSVSGTYTFSTGEPLTPSYVANIADVSRGSTGSLRPDRIPGSSLTTGAGTLKHWFNTAAFDTNFAPGQVYGTASRFSIPGPGTVSFDASLSKTIHLTETRTFELRATADNAFNTVQYAGVNTTLGSNAYGQVTSAAAMRQFTFLGRFRF